METRWSPLRADKERVLRLVSAMCGSRFGRGVVVPGGVSAFPRKRVAEIEAQGAG
jgi:formate hydrogenlyase subunit 5